MNNEDFMNLLSASVNDNHQAQAQAPVDHSVWGYFDTHGNYFSPSQTALDPLMGVPGPTTSNENETNRYSPFIPVFWAQLIVKNAGGDPGSGRND